MHPMKKHKAYLKLDPLPVEPPNKLSKFFYHTLQNKTL